MLIFIVGTRAQIIKIAPILRDLDSRDVGYKFILTGQHHETIEDLVKEFGIRIQPRCICSESESSHVFGVIGWSIRAFFRLLLKRRDYFSGPNTQNIIVVHGDTISTLLGALVGCILGIRVAHVESGLRSNNVFHPFPEEIIRLITFRFTDIAFCPGVRAVENMEAYKKAVLVNTLQNTIIDSMRYAIKQTNEMSFVNRDDYCVVSIHRFENIFSKKRLRLIVEIVVDISSKYRVIFVLHPATKNRLDKSGLMGSLDVKKSIELVDRMGYIQFIKLVSHAAFVMTDGGSNQEELSYIGVPTLILRKATERQEGLESTAVISAYDRNVINSFIMAVEKESSGRSLNIGKPELNCSPSSIIADYLIEHQASEEPGASC